MVLLPLPDGRWLSLSEAAWAEALRAGAEAAGAVPVQAPVARCDPEPWLDSRQLAAVTGLGDTTLEHWAKTGRIPCLRAGKALRFKLSEVEAALRRNAT